MQTGAVKFSVRQKRLWLFCFLTLCFVSISLYALLPVRALSAETADRIVVIKSEHKMMLLRGGTVIRSYQISLGRGGKGQKVRAGDHKTPEGSYTIDWRNPKSHFHLSLHISYPNATDIERAREHGFAPGGDIMIHGLQNGLGWIGRFHRVSDWTDGCIAVTDSEMDQIWRAVPDGTPIEIRP
ncbi:MAG: L,D-transpeptidase family protein [Candidatus Acidiferrales bacterium]